MADRRSEADELRARRYQEAKEREWRAAEHAAAEKATAMQADLAAARDAQRRSKLQLQVGLFVCSYGRAGWQVGRQASGGGAAGGCNTSKGG